MPLYNQFAFPPCELCLRPNCFSPPTEPEYDFDKNIQDIDSYEKEDAEFVCEVSDPDAQVTWWKEDKVGLFIAGCDVIRLGLHAPYKTSIVL